MKQKNILVVGVDQVMPKLFYMAEYFAEVGLKYAIYAPNQGGRLESICKPRGICFKSSVDNCRISHPWRIWREWSRFRNFLRGLNPVHVEFFASGTAPVSLVVYLLACRKQGVPIVAWFRGELRNLKLYSFAFRAFLKFFLSTAKLVVVKEMYMPKILEEEYSKALQKSIVISNTILN